MIKRIFDFCMAFILILLFFWLIFLLFFLASIETQSFGLFFQNRVGQYGKLFTIIKIKSMDNQKNIRPFGKFIRKYKLDELPQLFNILFGQMSFVGPRPDIQGYYDTLQGEFVKILNLKPGLTSPAALFFFNEEEMLQDQKNPLQVNNEIYFPEKLKLNLEYYYNQNFCLDLQIIFQTIRKYL